MCVWLVCYFFSYTQANMSFDYEAFTTWTLSYVSVLLTRHYTKVLWDAPINHLCCSNLYWNCIVLAIKVSILSANAFKGIFLTGNENVFCHLVRTTCSNYVDTLSSLQSKYLIIKDRAKNVFKGSFKKQQAVRLSPWNIVFLEASQYLLRPPD